MDSLFFVKTRISNECEIKAEITYENVFCRCGECGTEFAVDLMYWADLIAEEGIGCYGHTVYCEECTQKRRNKKAVD